jgi:hypothetical protein
MRIIEVIMKQTHFQRGLTSYLHYLCLFVCSSVVVLLCCSLSCCQFLRIFLHFFLSLRYSLTFIYKTDLILDIMFSPNGLLVHKDLCIIWLLDLSILSVPAECYTRNTSCTLNWISTFLLKDI